MFILPIVKYCKYDQDVSIKIDCESNIEKHDAIVVDLVNQTYVDSRGVVFKIASV